MADNTKVMNETHEHDDLLNKDTGEVAREAVRMLRALTKQVTENSSKLEEVDKNTRILPGFIKAVRNMVAKFTGDLDKDVMEK